MPILETWQDYQDQVLLSGIGVPMTEFMGRVFLRNMSAFGLSRAERAVAQQVRRGLNNKEIVMALHVRQDRMPYSVDVVQKELYPSSEMLTRLTGQGVQVNKAIVGRNAFAHEAGIHQDGMLKDRRTYEIMRAEDVGAPWNPLVLGRHSGRHAVQKRCTDLGLTLDVTELGDVYRALMAMADDRKVLADQDVVQAVGAVRAARPASVS